VEGQAVFVAFILFLAVPRPDLGGVIRLWPAAATFESATTTSFV
jgi:hypothetical protein